MPSGESCATCRFAKKHPEYEHQYRLCVRYPPPASESNTLQSRVPTVEKDWWCGEWKGTKPVRSKEEILGDFT